MRILQTKQYQKKQALYRGSYFDSIKKAFMIAYLDEVLEHHPLTSSLDDVTWTYINDKMRDLSFQELDQMVNISLNDQAFQTFIEKAKQENQGL